MAAWDTAKRSGLLATVKFHWDKTGSNVILECRFPVCKSHTLKLVSSHMTTHLHMLSSQSARHWWQQKRCQNRSFNIKEIFCWWFFVDLPCAQSSQLQWLWFFNCIWFWASGARLTAESKLSITWESFPTFLILPLSCRNWLWSSSHWRHPEVLTKHRTATRQTWFGISAGWYYGWEEPKDGAPHAHAGRLPRVLDSAGLSPSCKCRTPCIAWSNAPNAKLV